MRPPDIRITVRRRMVAMVVFAVYLAIYRALVLASILQKSQWHPDQVGESYRYSPRFCTVVFAPANLLDRSIRPRYCSKPACVW
jgi:hypothetical protein